MQVEYDEREQIDLHFVCIKFEMSVRHKKKDVENELEYESGV